MYLITDTYFVTLNGGFEFIKRVKSLHQGNFLSPVHIYSFFLQTNKEEKIKQITKW